ncbi:MAG: hypothetical protein EON60_03365 [Alphaproteobacteria bacterium]|nr:MAG: hypothetical protein EON60_03365 [Alphaproteobacteria bacterium]
MRAPVIISAIVVGLIAAFVGYNYMQQPRPLSDRLESGVDQLGAGNLGEAAQEVGNETQGEKLQDDLNDMTTPEPAPAPAN